MFRNSRDTSGRNSRDTSGRNSRDTSGRNSRDTSGRNSRDTSGRNSHDTSVRNSRDTSVRNFCDTLGCNSRDTSGRNFPAVFAFQHCWFVIFRARATDTRSSLAGFCAFCATYLFDFRHNTTLSLYTKKRRENKRRCTVLTCLFLREWGND